MKKLLVVLVVLVATTTALTTASARSGIAASRACAVRSHLGPARLTVKVLHMENQIVYANKDSSKVEDLLAKGPVWDPWNDLDPYSAKYKPVRPGSGKTLVIDGHDVTPVPGYGAHGPFYRLHLIRPGYLAKLTWRCDIYTYRFVAVFARRQCASKRANDSAAHLNGELICEPFNRPIYGRHWKVPTLFLRCCWPRYTRRQFLYARAVLIGVRRIP